jgi:hypothetical protein
MVTHRPQRFTVALVFSLVALPATARPPHVTAQACCLSQGLRIAEQYRAAGIETRRFTHAELWQALAVPLESPDLTVHEIGHSIHGRALRAVTFGEGATKVLLWSQMHGNESTATMSLADIITFFAEATDNGLRERLRRELTIVMVPMLNPDGAQVFQRENAVGVDINRDARRLATPEARALKKLRDRFDPHFGFNLHDQNARTLAGEGGDQVAIALLPPAATEDRAHGPIRARARYVAALLAELLEGEIPGRLAKYNDAFNPRAFGDLMQAWGTSTVLIESGALPDDPEKQRLRAINVAAILSTLEAMPTGRFRGADTLSYEGLPFNRRIANDIHLVGGRVVLGDHEPLAVDIALRYDDPVAGVGLRVGEVGDLADAAALDTLDVSGLFIHLDTTSSDFHDGGWWLERGAPAALTVRLSEAPDSEIMHRFGEEQKQSN